LPAVTPRPPLLRLALAALALAGALAGPPTAHAQSAGCLDVGATRCLSTPGALVEPVRALLEIPEGRALLRNAADRRVRLRMRRLGDDLRGYYQASTRVILISRDLERRAVQVRAVILAHELQHATERGDDDETTEDCYWSEEAAFQVEARIWPQLWPGQTPPDDDEYARDANELVRQVARDPEGLARDVRDLYHEDCEADPAATANNHR
jgi:hypothetical protein